MSKYPILILANKQDLPNALSPEDIWSSLGVQDLAKKKVKIIKSCGKTAEGVPEGLDWIIEQLKS